jgi:hypothetical protein
MTCVKYATAAVRGGNPSCAIDVEPTAAGRDHDPGAGRPSRSPSRTGAGLPRLRSERRSTALSLSRTRPPGTQRLSKSCNTRGASGLSSPFRPGPQQQAPSTAPLEGLNRAAT